MCGSLLLSIDVDVVLIVQVWTLASVSFISLNNNEEQDIELNSFEKSLYSARESLRCCSSSAQLLLLLLPIRYDSYGKSSFEYLLKHSLHSLNNWPKYLKIKKKQQQKIVLIKNWKISIQLESSRVCCINYNTKTRTTKNRNIFRADGLCDLKEKNKSNTKSKKSFYSTNRKYRRISDENIL